VCLPLRLRPGQDLSTVGIQNVVGRSQAMLGIVIDAEIDPSNPGTTLRRLAIPEVLALLDAAPIWFSADF
jgi:hypothetical protein